MSLMIFQIRVESRNILKRIEFLKRNNITNIETATGPWGSTS